MQTTIELGQLIKPKIDGSLIIPASFRDRLKLNKKSLLKIILVGNSLVISPYAKTQNNEFEDKLETYSSNEMARILKEDRQYK